MTRTWFIDHLWLVPLLPFLGFLVQALALKPFKPNVSSTVAIAAMLGATVVGWGAAFEYFGHAHGQTLVPLSLPWLRFSESLIGSMGVLVDDISMLLVVVVTTISTLIHIYSTGYMHGDKGYRRFFAFLNLFSFSMLGLVLAVSVLQIFIFWELVGVSSFLLIGYYWEKPSAVAACKKAFIVTRFADLGFLIGLLLLSYYAGKLDFVDLNSKETIDKLAAAKTPILGMSLLPLSAILVFCGAAGKSAMFPLHIWLPDAMEGPTPVSALIHAATMVVAGVYLVARLFPIFAASTAAIGVVMVVGTFTALFAAVIAITQFDIKRVLAYLDALPARLHDAGAGRGHDGQTAWLHCVDVPPHHPRLLQGPAVPGRGQRDPRRPHQRHAGDGRAAQEAALDARDLPDCLPGHCRRAAAVGLLLEGRDSGCGLGQRALPGLLGGACWWRG